MSTPHANPAPASSDPRPGLVILCGELTPYRVHFHRRVANEIPELRLTTLLFRDSAWSAWKRPDLPEIGVVALGEGDWKGPRGRAAGAASQWRRSAGVVRWLSEHRIAAVLVNGYDELPQLRAFRWCRRHGVPSLMWADSNIRADNPTGLRRLVKRAVVPRLLRGRNALLACGSLGRAYYRRYGVPDNQIFYSPVEPDYDLLARPDPAAAERARDLVGSGGSRRRFVVSSRLVPHKRVDRAIAAFTAIADRRPEWDLVILGDGPERAALEAMVPRPLSPRVRFAGFVGQQEVVTAVYRASHILVHPASYEPWALVINEAAAAGLAIVSTDVVGASAELVRDGENGRLVPVDDAAALERGMLETSDPARLEAMRAASPTILAQWRATADPVAGLRAALRQVGALPS